MKIKKVKGSDNEIYTLKICYPYGDEKNNEKSKQSDFQTVQ